MFHKLQNFLINGLVSLLLLLILFFPLVNFKINIVSPIFPAFEIIFIYFLVCYYNFTEGKILVAGLFMDQLYSMPSGCNSLAFLIGSIFFKYMSRQFLIKNYTINFMVFFAYAFVILICRYLIFLSLSQYPSIFELIFQYLTTIFSYPLLRIFLDKLLQYSKFNNAK